MSARVLLVSVNGRAEEVVREALEPGAVSLSIVQDPSVAPRDLALHQLVIVDAANDEAVAGLCRELRAAEEAAGGRRPLLAITGSADVEQRIGLLEAGADDVLVQPFDPRELQALLDALLLRSAPAGGGPAEAQAGAGPLVGTRPGQAFVFAAAKGGVGCTTLAVNTAIALAESTRTAVALADLDFHHGQVATHLDVQGPATTADLARDEVTLEDASAMWQSAFEHPSGVHVFAAPHRPDLGAAVDHAQAVALLRALRRAFPMVVIDAGSVLDWRSLALMDAADRLVMVLTPEIPSLRLLHGALEVMAEGETATDRTLFVLNNVFARQPVTAEQIEEHLTVKIALEVPYEAELYLTAANEGQPLLLAAPRSAQAESIRRLAAMLRGQQAATDEAPEKRGRLGGLLKRG